ncbi:MAG: glycerol-3-phosphate dehydrogenase [Deltaproteobacteria bacterium]|nr:MAG: glycerol-3-phosphate dehydrogenase [Deltaproteobacteria bacterium]
MPTRREMWDKLGEPVDFLIIGGGINGAGIARDAARRGLKVALVEMNDLAYGTSSRSSKLVHGGLRYLEHMEFSLVFEAVSERRILMDIAPHLVNPLGFLFPIYDSSRQGLLTLRAGMWLYDGLSLFRSPKLHRSLTPKGVADEEPLLRQKGLKGAPLYYDCSTDDARLTLESALDAVKAGAVVATWARCTELIRDPSGKVGGAVIRDELGGEERRIEASVVINATGPWTDRTLSLSQALDAPLLRPTKGVHIVVPANRLPVRHAVVCLHPSDGRVLFAIPWGDVTYLGTTDTDWEGDPAELAADAADVRYLIDAANEYFPTGGLQPADVISTWAGLRPLMRPVAKKGEKIDESAVSREHQVVVGQDGIVTIAGGKLTTFRKMSAEVVDTGVKLLRMVKPPMRLSPAYTDREPLPGAIGWPEDDDHAKVAEQVAEAAQGNLSPVSALNLVDTYGMRAMEIARMVVKEPSLATPLSPDRPELEAQVRWAAREELAATVTDVLLRRTQVFYRAKDQGLAAATRVAEILADELGWSAEERERSVQEYAREVALSRRWQEETSSAD